MRKEVPKYRLYALALASALSLYWTIGVYMSVAAGFNWTVVAALLGSILQFGIGSWLFLFKNKVGRICSISFLALMSLLPVASLIPVIIAKDIFSIIAYLMIILLITPQIWTHIQFFNKPPAVNSRVKWLLAIPPLFLFFAYIFHLISMFQTGQLSFN